MREFDELNAKWKRCIFDEAPIAMGLVDANGRYLRLNDAYCALLGYPRGELLQRTWQSVTFYDDIEGNQRGSDALRLDVKADIYSDEKRYITKSGEQVWVKLYVRAVREEDGAFVCFYDIVVPIKQHAKQSILERKPISLIEWVKSHPTDATLLGGAACAVFGRDAIIELVRQIIGLK